MSSPKDIFIEFPAGATVFKEGDAGSEMYVIETGHVDILHPSGTGEIMASYGPGDFFGEAAIVEDAPRPATALAKERTRLLRVERAAFAEVLRQNAEIGVRIMRRMLARERIVEQRLRDALGELSKARGVGARPEPPRAAPAATAPVAAAPALAQKIVLRVASGEALPLDAAHSEFLIGRPDPATGSTPEVNLGPFDANRTLSRRHAKITREGGVYFLREESASNGTFVNGERLQPGVKVPIKPGDKLRFGMIEVEMAVA
jgi:hypothetical protein